MSDYLIIDDFDKSEFSNSINGRVLGPFGMINVLVGKNNSGKSRFLRSIFHNQNYSNFLISNLDRNWTTLSNQLISGISALGAQYGSRNPLSQKYIEYSNFISTKYFDSPSRSQLIEFIGAFELVNEKNVIDFPILEDHRNITKIKELSKQTIDSLRHSLSKQNSNNILYIPILRGLRPIQQEANGEFTNKDVYVGRTKKDYNFPKNNVLIYTGLTMFEDVKKLLLGTEEQRKLIADFEIFLEKFIFSEKVTLIPKYDTDVLHIKIGSEQQLEIFNLGDGLQTIISILFPLFTRKEEECRVLIEEPETHLHPDWQVKLLFALKEFKKHQFFITSHSSVFINDQISTVLSVKKDGEKIYIDNIDEKSILTILKDLGYKPSDLLISNYILWVEGQSDKIYFKTWLKLAAPHLEEGQHYTIMVIGGENYKHLLSDKEGGFNLTLLENLNPNFGLILDSDKDSSKAKLSEAKSNILKLFQSKEAFCWITEKREIENYIPDKLFIDAITTYSQKKNIEIAKGPFVNRNKVLDLDSKPQLKPTIKIPGEFFKKIQKHKLKAIIQATEEELKSMLKDALSQNSSIEFEIKKVLVAKEVSKNSTEVPIDISPKLNELIQIIEKANHINITKY